MTYKTFILYSLVFLLSCSKDTIVGIWERTGVEIDGKLEWEIHPTMVCYKHDGTYNAGRSIRNLEHTGTWSYNSANSTFTIVDSLGGTSEYYMLKLTKNEMVIAKGLHKIYWTKIKDVFAYKLQLTPHTI